MTKNEIYNLTINEQSFEQIKHIDEYGNEFWYARELQEVLGYTKWENFHKIIKTAQIACKISKQDVLYHFPEVRKMIQLAKGAQRKVIDYKLSRYACYLVVMNGDPRKKQIALGQTYFAVKTRQQELDELYNALTEDEKRLFIRGDIKQKNKLLAEAAHKAGIDTEIDYATFQDAGYKGLYGGMSAQDIAHKKGLTKGQEILDFMGSEELGANLFRITQTEAKMKRENINTPSKAKETHFKVGTIVRKAIKETGGTMPEDLPTPKTDIKALESNFKRQIKSNKKNQ